MKCPLRLGLVHQSNERVAGVGGEVAGTGHHHQADQRQEANLGDEANGVGADVVPVLVDDEEAAAADEHVRAGEQVQGDRYGEVTDRLLEGLIQAEEARLQQ